MMVKYKELSGWLKAGIIGGWISIVVFGLSALIGFIDRVLI